MHELSIALSLLDVAAEEAAKRGVQVVALHLKLGALSGVVREALLGAFDLARETSELPDSRLVIQDVPIVVYCPRCECEQPAVSPQQICCATCGTPTPQIISGRELELVGLEVVDCSAGMAPRLDNGA